MAKSKSKKRRLSLPPHFGSLGFPYAPNFLQEQIQSQNSKPTAYNNRLLSTTPLDLPTTPLVSSVALPNSLIQPVHSDQNSFRYTTVSTSNHSISIVAINVPAAYYISGRCTITVLWGSVNINGYRLEMNKPKSIFSPVWMPALPAQISGNKRSSSYSPEYKKKLLKTRKISES